MTISIDIPDSLRDKYNTNLASDDASPFPLWASLLVYIKAAKCESSIFYAFEDYEEYINTVKLLFKWLTPVQVEAAEKYINKYIEHDLLGNSVTVEVIPKELNTCPEVIIGTLIEEVLPRMKNAPTPEEMYYEYT